MKLKDPTASVLNGLWYFDCTILLTDMFGSLNQQPQAFLGDTEPYPLA